MDIIQIEIRNKSALSILKGMEKAQIIRLLRGRNKRENEVIINKGIFSRERAMELAGIIDKSREEWDGRTT
jgi:hypothetical protein